MSAGGLSYSGIINYGKATLPSVDSWGTNMNILKDPPKSITTRKIDLLYFIYKLLVRKIISSHNCSLILENS